LRSLEVSLGRCLNGLGLGQVALRLGQRGFERPGIDLKQQISLFNEAPLLVIPLQQVAGHSRPDIGVVRSIQRTDPLLDDRDIGFDDISD
jgi:hypothetical protein